MVNLFNIFLIILITFVSYRYFALKESLAPNENRAFAYVKAMGQVLDRIEGYESLHAGEIAEIAQEIALAKSLDGQEVQGIIFAAQLHDLGEALLSKDLFKAKEKLDEDQLFLLRTHPLLGEMELKNNDFPYDEVPALIRWHHERFDGSGYPDGLKAKEIPLGARILTLADSVSAMKNVRPYRDRKLSSTEILRELDLQSGLQFDPELVEIYKMLYLQNTEEAEA
jgi:HD-GYP domain-containing protein (c-di-GMP phosphodiesterase class II)